jgi:hypothetical protein
MLAAIPPMTLTVREGMRREASPPAKSELPYKMAAIRPRMIPIVMLLLHVCCPVLLIRLSRKPVLAIRAKTRAENRTNLVGVAAAWPVSRQASID